MSTPTHLDGAQFIAARVVGIDPGKQSGLAIVDLTYGYTKPLNTGLFKEFSPQLVTMVSIPQTIFAKTMREICQDLLIDPLYPCPIVIVNEHYTVTRLTQQSQDTQAIEITGTLQGVLGVLEVKHDYFEQSPSEAKIVMTNARLKNLNLLPVATDDHSRDALRHALLWCMRYANAKVALTDPFTTPAEPGKV